VIRKNKSGAHGMAVSRNGYDVGGWFLHSGTENYLQEDALNILFFELCPRNIDVIDNGNFIV